MKIIIVGGNAAGMSCAARARRNDETADIIVFERGDAVSYASCGLPYYIGEEIEERGALLVQTPQSLSAVLNIDVRIHHEVTAIDPESHSLTVDTPTGRQSVTYDALVLTPGAKPFVPHIPGINASFVSTLRTVDDADRIMALAQNATSVVVLGGGFIGIEAAESLARRGLDVHIVDLADHVLPMMETEIASVAASQLYQLGVDIHTGLSAHEIIDTANSRGVKLSDGSVIPADMVLVSIGVRPDTTIFEQAEVQCKHGAIVTDEHGRTSQPDIWAAGDATLCKDLVTGTSRVVALAGPANRAGRLIADDICNPRTARTIPQTLGTSIIRIGSLTIARTGANRSDLEQMGIPLHTIHLEASQHAGYFPGARPMTILVFFAHNGRILGAQIAGGEGVDKRIDALSSAMRAQASIEDLIDEDLAYSPPFGQAKDPINLVGMLGENVLSGKLRLWYADELPDVVRTNLVLDVRSAAEFSTGHVRGALNVPHTEVRTRLDEIRQTADGRDIAVMCASGKRSYFVYRILDQEGLRARNLSGGIHVLKNALSSDMLKTFTTLSEDMA